MKMYALLLVIVIGMVVVGCERQQAASVTPAGGTSAQAVLPAGLVLASAPGEAKTVKEIRTAGKDGDEVVMRGVIAGRKDPIAENRAVLTLLDPAVATCDKLKPGSAMADCKTPWDACCEPPEVLAANSATVQVVDEKGSVLKTGLGQVAGVKPLKEVVVKGKLHVSPDGKAVVVDASGLYVTP
jgi:hypothetical protein